MGDRGELLGRNFAGIFPVSIAAILIGSFVSLVLRRFYYITFPLIQSFNTIYPPGTLAPLIEEWTVERDGIEIYALYILVIAIIGLTALLVFGLSLLKVRWMQALIMLHHHARG